jgi:hypothetical protein
MDLQSNTQQNIQLQIDAYKERERLEEEGIGDQLSELQQFTWKIFDGSKLKSSPWGIDMLCEYTDNDRGCTGEFLKEKMFSNGFFCQCNVVGMVWYMNTHQGRILIFFYHVRNVYKLSFPTSFCLFGSLVLGFLVILVLVLLSEGILVSCFLVVHSYCQLILLYTCRSYIFYFNK